jgi:hypothetical protein
MAAEVMELEKRINALQGQKKGLDLTIASFGDPSTYTPEVAASVQSMHKVSE